MPKTLQFRRGSTAALASQTGSVGELFVDTSKTTVVVMNGATPGGVPLATESFVSAVTRGGVTSITLTASTSSFTLSSSTDQLIRVLGNSSTTYGITMTMPNMTTVPLRASYFIINNLTSFDLAVQDVNGVLREFVPALTQAELTIQSTSTAVGIWYWSETPKLLGQVSATNVNFLPSTSLSTLVYNVNTVPFNSSQLALLWTEGQGNQSADIGCGSFVGYRAGAFAQLCTVNLANYAVTVSSRVTIIPYSTSGGNLAGNAPRGDWCYDSDYSNNVVANTAANGVEVSNAANWTIIMTANGSNLHWTSSLVSTGPINQNDGSAAPLYVAWLGVPGQFGYAFHCSQTNGPPYHNIYWRSLRVTGNALVQFSSSNASTGNNGGPGPILAARTSFNTFITNEFSTSSYCRSISYNAALNTLTSVIVASPLVQPRIISGSVPADASIAQGGFSYGPNQVIYNGNTFFVSSPGVTAVTATLSTATLVRKFTTTDFTLRNEFVEPAISFGRGCLINSTSILVCNSPLLPTSRITDYRYNDTSSNSLNIVSALASDSVPRPSCILSSSVMVDLVWASNTTSVLRVFRIAQPLVF